MDYVPSTGPQALFPQASLSLCPAVASSALCAPDTVQTTLTLATSHVGKGCDRDTYDVDSQRRICGAKPEAIDLLAAGVTNATRVKDEGAAADSSITFFDGDASGLAVSASAAAALKDTSLFTLSAWMRHARRQNLDKNAKEHILCKADDHSK
jgi:hypothetical protein